VVLLSPDDVGYRDADGPDAARARARQNVIMELGYFAGKLGRQRVVALHRGDIELPSDYGGVLYTTPYDAGGAWPYRLTGELREGATSLGTTCNRSYPSALPHYGCSESTSPIALAVRLAEAPYWWV
jgi:hypothetical protein